MGFSSSELALEILFTNFKDRIEFPEEKKYLIEKISQLTSFDLKNSTKTKEERIKLFEYSDDNIRDLISTNAILTLRNERNKISPLELCYGLYINCSFFNHSCDPNCFYFGIAFKDDSAVQRPEKLYKEKPLLLYILLIIIISKNHPAKKY